MSEKGTGTPMSAALGVVLLVGLAAIMAWRLLPPILPLDFRGVRPATVVSFADTSGKMGLRSNTLVQLEDGRLFVLSGTAILNLTEGTRICARLWESADQSQFRVMPSDQVTC